jgi:hypothetical protein
MGCAGGGERRPDEGCRDFGVTADPVRRPSSGVTDRLWRMTVGDTPGNAKSHTRSRGRTRTALWQVSDGAPTPRVTGQRSQFGSPGRTEPSTSGPRQRRAFHWATTSRRNSPGLMNWRSRTTSRRGQGGKRHCRWAPKPGPRQREAPRQLGGKGGRLDRIVRRTNDGPRVCYVLSVPRLGARVSPLGVLRRAGSSAAS